MRLFTIDRHKRQGSEIRAFSQGIMANEKRKDSLYRKGFNLGVVCDWSGGKGNKPYCIYDIQASQAGRTFGQLPLFGDLRE